ncbi:hypothetical protein ACTVQY_24030, partial [Klebsiella pneumoniae]|uniref:hypothetical protein n=1 Tax=Klebsiella pneumoniae TaxID=573 RepID=UPI003FA584A7
MMSLWDALRMNMMISYQELVRTFPNNDTNFHDASSLICLTTFFPEYKPFICNEDHIMRIKLPQ